MLKRIEMVGEMASEDSDWSTSFPLPIGIAFELCFMRLVSMFF
jgi:hypothetical protein